MTIRQPRTVKPEWITSTPAQNLREALTTQAEEPSSKKGRNNLRVVVLAQEDGLLIPTNIVRLSQVSEMELVLVAKINVQGSLVNRKSLFVRGFGLWQSLRMAWVLARIRLLDWFDRLTGCRWLSRPRSLSAAAIRCDATFRTYGNPNEAAVVDELRQLAPDLIVSFSAPCVFKPALLGLPRLGCINLHCSYLPKYAGLLPSFWALFHGEQETGATVHCMDDKIDNGVILGQVKVPIRNGMSMFDLICETKRSGGTLMCRVVEQLIQGKGLTHHDRQGPGSYFSWPTIEQMRQFRLQGGRLI